MHYVIYGAGALGQALGCMLSADGNQITLVMRKRYIDVIDRDGLTVSGIFGTYRADSERLSLVESINSIDGSDFDAVLITTKSYDTETAVSDISSLKNCTCPVVSLQNGCGNVEQIEARFGTERSFGGRVITGFEIERPAQVTITVSADDVHIGSCRPGSIPAAASSLAAAINRAGLPCKAVPDVHQSLFAKLLYNCTLNPLGAILGVNYGRLSEVEDTKRVMDQVIDETFSVINAMGTELEWESPEQYRKTFYETLLPATYDHRPSMLQDLEQGKPTEIEALSGYVSKNGKAHGIATPYCDLLGSLIRFKERA